MVNRSEFQKRMEREFPGVSIYFQPPSNIRMAYPAIIYSLKDVNKFLANDSVFHVEYSYEVIAVSLDPDDPMLEKLSSIPTSFFDRSYISDGLYHTVFSIY